MKKLFLIAIVMFVSFTLLAKPLGGEPEFRDVRWFCSPEVVLDRETAEYLDGSIQMEDTMEIVYLFYGMDYMFRGEKIKSIIFYKFYDEKLMKAGYWFSNIFGNNAQDYVELFEHLKHTMIEVYGHQQEDGFEWLESLSFSDRHYYENNIVEAIQDGVMELFTVWRYENSYITLSLMTYPSGLIDVSITFWAR